MRLAAFILAVLVLAPLTTSADWKKPYFGATPVGSWATYTTKASAGPPSVTTSLRLDDRAGRVRIEDRTTYPGKEFPPSAQRYELAPGFNLKSDLLDFAGSLATVSSSMDGAAFQPMPAASVRTMKDMATAVGAIAVFVRTETVDGRECDSYTYSVRIQATGQAETGEVCLSDAVPFGVVRRAMSNADQSGQVVWSMEQRLTASGMPPIATTTAKPVAPKAPATAKPAATQK